MSKLTKAEIEKSMNYLRGQANTLAEIKAFIVKNIGWERQKFHSMNAMKIGFTEYGEGSFSATIQWLNLILREIEKLEVRNNA